MERDEEGPMRSENPGAVVSGALPRLEPLRSVRTDALEVTYFEAGPSDGEVEHLLHGSPYTVSLPLAEDLSPCDASRSSSTWRKASTTIGSNWLSEQRRSSALAWTTGSALR